MGISRSAPRIRLPPVLCPTASSLRADPRAPAPRGGAGEQGPGSPECSEMPPPSSRGSGPAMPDRKERSGGRGVAPEAPRAFRPRRAWQGGRRGSGAGAAARLASPHRVFVLVRPSPGQQQQQQRGGRRHARSARQRPHPPRSHRPGAGPPTPPPPPPIRIHRARTDARGPGPAAASAAVTARSAPPPPPGLRASSSDSATSSGHPGTRRKSSRRGAATVAGRGAPARAVRGVEGFRTRCRAARSASARAQARPSGSRQLPAGWRDVGSGEPGSLWLRGGAGRVVSLGIWGLSANTPFHLVQGRSHGLHKLLLWATIIKLGQGGLGV